MGSFPNYYTVNSGGETFVQTICVAQYQPRCHSVGADLHSLPTGESPPAHRLWNRQDRCPRRQVRGPPLGPRRTLAPFTWMYTLADSGRSFHQVAGSLSHIRHNHTRGRKDPHQRLDRPLWSPVHHDFRQRTTIHLTAVGRNSPASGCPN